MKYLKLNINTSKEECKLIEDKIKKLGYIGDFGDFTIDLKRLKEGYVYIYRSLNTNVISQYICQPHRYCRQIKNSKDYGEEITIEEFLKL